MIDIEFEIAQLRHLYSQLVLFYPGMANGLLSPTIARLEEKLKEHREDEHDKHLDWKFDHD